VRNGTGTGRGRHKNAGSPETKRWLEVAPTVDGWKPEPKVKKAKPQPLGSAPECPPWLDEESFRLLCEMRSKL
jgi:hypothetical protein